MLEREGWTTMFLHRGCLSMHSSSFLPSNMRLFWHTRALACVQVLGRPGGGRPAGGGAQWRQLCAGWQRGAERARARPGPGRRRPRAGQHHRQPQVLGRTGAACGLRANSVLVGPCAWTETWWQVTLTCTCRAPTAMRLARQPTKHSRRVPGMCGSEEQHRIGSCSKRGSLCAGC